MADSPRGAVVGKLARAWLADTRGCALLGAWAATFAGVTLRAWLGRRRRPRLPPPPRADPEATAVAVAPAEAPKPKPMRALLRRAIPRWDSAPVAWAALLSAGIGLRLVVSVKMSREVGVLGSLLAQRQWEALFRRQLSYALFAVPAALLNALQKYAATRFSLSLRAKLMADLHGGMGATSSLPLVYHAAAPEAEAESAVQLATADVAAFSAQAVAVFEGLVKPSAEVVLWAAINSRVAADQQPSSGRLAAEWWLINGRARRWCCSRRLAAD